MNNNRILIPGLHAIVCSLHVGEEHKHAFWAACLSVSGCKVACRWGRICCARVCVGARACVRTCVPVRFKSKKKITFFLLLAISSETHAFVFIVRVYIDAHITD
jgi:hypothetical protein